VSDVDSDWGSAWGFGVVDAIVRAKFGCVKVPRAVNVWTRVLGSWLRSRRNEVNCLDGLIGFLRSRSELVLRYVLVFVALQKVLLLF